MKPNFLILFVLIFLFSGIYLYANTNDVFTTTSVGEYSYTLITNQNVSSDENEQLSFMIERQEFPLVNRLVRFINFTPDIITFDNNTNIFVIATDENGTANANIQVKKKGRGVVGIHVLYVGTTGNTNITYDTFTTLNAEEGTTFEHAIGDAGSIIPNLVFVFIFITPILILLLGYYKRLYKEIPNSEQNIIISVLLGFSNIKNRFVLMVIVSLSILSILALTIFSNSILIPLALTLLSLSGLSLRRSRIMAINFLLLSLLNITSIIFKGIIFYSGIETSASSTFLSNFVFIFFLFLVITAFLSGIYIPSFILLIYSQIFALNTTGVVTGLIAIFLSSVLYIVQYKYIKKTLPLFYIINMLKIGD